MKSQLMYVELKTGFSDDGPAWIGNAFFSKSGQSIYFNGLSFAKGNRYGGNYYEILDGDYYWVSGIKKGGTNRHWAGHGKIQIDKNVIAEFLEVTKQARLPENRFTIVELNNIPAIDTINKYLNMKF